MTTKFISLATALVLLDVSLQSLSSSNVPLFLFASSNLAVNTALLLTCGLMVVVSFKTRFARWQVFAACAAGGCLLIMTGVMGMFLSDTDYWFPSFLLPLNYLFMIEAGIVFSICALSYEHPAIPFRIRLPRTAVWLPRFVPPVPKIPHFPTSLSRSYGLRRTA